MTDTAGVPFDDVVERDAAQLAAWYRAAREPSTGQTTTPAVVSAGWYSVVGSSLRVRGEDTTDVTYYDIPTLLMAADADRRQAVDVALDRLAQKMAATRQQGDNLGQVHGWLLALIEEVREELGESSEGGPS